MMVNPAPFEIQNIWKIKKRAEMGMTPGSSQSSSQSDTILTDDSLSRSHTKLNHLTLPNVATFLLIRLTRV